jgi:meso-butanediol dehydrogenase / (S,S)-butanediol dehydrogenase / diacetyl reductase
MSHQMAGALSGKVALITGAGQGVGEGCAIALADEGAAVACVGRTLSKVERVAKTIESRGGAAIALRADVTDADDIRASVDATLERFGTIDILVNNAVQPPAGRLNDLDEEKLEQGWRSGPLAAFRYMRACYPHLKGGGVIVNMGTGSALLPNLSGMGGYAMCKEAMRMLTRAAACEWGADGIRANAVLPLALSPAMAAHMDNLPPGRHNPLDLVPLGRIGDVVEDIGRAVAMLCRPEMSYVTGTTLALDGGQTPMR